MPVYLFHIVEGNLIINDAEGGLLSDLDAAQRYAAEGAASLIAEATAKGIQDYTGCIHVEDETGAPAFSVAFSCSTRIEVSETGTRPARYHWD